MTFTQDDFDSALKQMNVPNRLLMWQWMAKNKLHLDIIAFGESRCLSTFATIREVPWKFTPAELQTWIVTVMDRMSP